VQPHSIILNVRCSVFPNINPSYSTVIPLLIAQDIHKALEKKIATFHGTDDAILYSSCFDANTGLFEVLVTKDDAILSDELNHASVIDGIRMCKAQKHRYLHRNMAGARLTILIHTLCTD